MWSWNWRPKPPLVAEKGNISEAALKVEETKRTYQNIQDQKKIAQEALEKITEVLASRIKAEFGNELQKILSFKEARYGPSLDAVCRTLACEGKESLDAVGNWALGNLLALDAFRTAHAHVRFEIRLLGSEGILHYSLEPYLDGLNSQDLAAARAAILVFKEELESAAGITITIKI